MLVFRFATRERAFERLLADGCVAQPLFGFGHAGANLFAVAIETVSSGFQRFFIECSEQRAGFFLDGFRDCRAVEPDLRGGTDAFPEMVDVFRDIAGAAGLGEIADVGSRRPDAKIKK
ncbi:hypothetical protein WT01_16760 [Burkholderia cepacia]|nr:hypothetical protein WT01_16760 [Burkholderia cepacia]